MTRGEVGLFFPLYQESDRLFFGDVRGRFFDENVQEGNAAIGYRQKVGDRVYGAWIGYDGRTTAFGNYFDQISGGIEVLNPNWEFRLNGYLPLTDSKVISTSTATAGTTGGPPTLALIGSQLFLTTGGFTMTTTNRELAMYGVDAEFGIRIPLSNGIDIARGTARGRPPKHDLRLYGGAFYFDHKDFAGEIAGVRARAEWRINDVLPRVPGSFAAIEVGYQYDDVRDGNFHGGVRLNIPLGSRRAAVTPDQYDPLMTGFVQRDPNIVTRTATETRQTAGTREAVNDAITGTALDRTIFVDPGQDLQAAITAAGENSHLVVNGGIFDGTFTLPDNFTLQGTGSVLNLVGRTSGTPAVFGAPGSIPTLQTTATTGADPTLGVGSHTHVLSFNISGPGTPTTAETIAMALPGDGIDGIAGRPNVTNVVIEQTSIRDTTGTGIDFSAGGDDIVIRNTLIERSGADGLGLRLNNSTITVDTVAILNSGNDGVDITGTPGDASTLSFSDVLVDQSGSTGIDIMNTGGTFTFANTDITGSGNQGLSITGSTTGMTFDANSSITHASDGAAVNIDGSGTPNTSNLTFDGVISDTAGLGLQFNNSDGTYNFNGQVTLNGGDAGIDILGGSAGTFTFTNTDITNPTGAGINIADSSADVSFGAASSITQGNNASAIQITNQSGGGLSFGGTIGATGGDGLQFNNADGTFTFTGITTLNGGDAGIDILGGSAGTFTFGDTTTITNPTGAGLNIANLEAGGVVNYNGSITNNNDVIYSIDTTAAGSEVNFNTNGSNALLSTDNPFGAVFIFDADGNITQTTQMTVTRPGFSAIFATDGDGTWTFDDLTIIDQSGLNGGVDIFGNQGTLNFDNLNITTDSAGTGDATTGFLAGGNNIINVTGNSNINADGGAALVLINVNQINMTFGDLISTNNTNTQIGFAGDDGIDLLNVGSGSLNVTGTTTVDNADGVAISIEGVGADVTFADVALSNIGQDGVISGVVFENTGTTTINGGTISSVGGDGLRFGSTFGGGVSTNADVNNVTFSAIGGFVADVANSTLSGSGNTAATFSCNDDGGNTGSILFNAGADSCP